MESKCARTSKNDGISCIDKTSILVKYAIAYNKHNPSREIKLNEYNEVNNPVEYKKYLISEITKRMNGICKNQLCWFKQPFVFQEFNNKDYEDARLSYLPEVEDNSFIYTPELEDALTQIKFEVKDFYSLGVSPLNYYEIPSSVLFLVSTSKISNLHRLGYKKFGGIFNLDPFDPSLLSGYKGIKKNTDAFGVKYGSGSHWTCIYVDIDKNFVSYFDSTGDRPFIQIKNLLTLFCVVCERYNNNAKANLFINSIPHQKVGVECGVYCIDYIRSMALGDNKYLSGQLFPNSEMKKKRFEYFNKKN